MWNLFMKKIFVASLLLLSSTFNAYIFRAEELLVCIGDHFTMGAERAAEAVKLVNPVYAIPMHYASFAPLMTGTPELFLSELKRRHLQRKFFEMHVEDTINLTHGR